MKRATKSAPWYTPGSQAMKNQRFFHVSEIQWIKTKWCNKNPTGTSNSVVPGSPNPLSHSRAAPGFIFARGESFESWKHYVYPAFCECPHSHCWHPGPSNHWNLICWWSQIYSWEGLTNKDSTPFCDYTIFFHLALRKSQLHPIKMVG